ncbi:unnamed protein product [Pleuronectes platessa]|uniref:Uncharacterized protein n=1 Tax=Pleuronectes platessa TaxID=8262 RepID=A0A9N7U532_PLEPL|nr:unnamed protein product [Pleuronectes platessa]
MGRNGREEEEEEERRVGFFLGGGGGRGARIRERAPGLFLALRSCLAFDTRPECSSSRSSRRSTEPGCCSRQTGLTVEVPACPLLSSASLPLVALFISRALFTHAQGRKLIMNPPLPAPLRRAARVSQRSGRLWVSEQPASAGDTSIRSRSHCPGPPPLTLPSVTLDRPSEEQS